MLSQLLTAACLMAVCVTVHAVGLTAAFRVLRRHRDANADADDADDSFGSLVWRLILIAGWIILLHLVEIVFWALLYAWKDAIPDLASSFYFSAVTYTTTGYGDLVLPKAWRLVGGVEALTGILLCGWSTGFFFAVVSRMYSAPRRPPRQTRPDAPDAPTVQAKPPQ
jgi:hypothetical protein